MTALATFCSCARTDFLRHTRNPAFWLVGLAAPVAALYMVPPPNADYAVLTINASAPILTPPVLGLILGIVTATILTPAAYIFLRAGPTRKRPWQVSDVAPYSRPAAALGRWAADVGALWLILAALTLASFFLGVFRLPQGEWNFIQTAIALWIPAAPALALVAAVRTVFDARPMLRSWPGDVLFVVLWMAFLVIAVSAAGTDGQLSQPMFDPFGIMTPILVGTAETVDSFTIGSAAGVEETIELDALAGVLDPQFLISRLAWLLIAAGAALIAGLVYQPRAARASRKGNSPQTEPQPGSMAPRPSISRLSTQVTPQPAALPTVSIVISQIKLILNKRIWLIAVLAAALAGAVFPYRIMGGPILALAVLFPLTTESARWQAGTSRALLNTTGTSAALRLALSIAAGTILLAIAHLPAIGRATLVGDAGAFAEMAFITLALPLTAMVLGALTRSAVTGRLVLLIAWYAYVSSAGG